MAQKKEAQDNEEKREMDLGDLTPSKDPAGGAKPVKPPPPFNPQPDPPG